MAVAHLCISCILAFSFLYYFGFLLVFFLLFVCVCVCFPVPQSYQMLIAQTDAEELPTVSVNPYFSFGQITKSVSDIKQHLNEFGNEELVKMAKTGEW